MKKLKSTLIFIVSFIWQLPQNILALLLITILSLMDECFYGGRFKGEYVVFNTVLPFTIALGDFIFISPYSSPEEIQYGLGYSAQSLLLGPLYLILVVIPYIIKYLLSTSDTTEYNSKEFFTNRWAIELYKMIHEHY